MHELTRVDTRGACEQLSVIADLSSFQIKQTEMYQEIFTDDKL